MSSLPKLHSTVASPKVKYDAWRNHTAQDMRDAHLTLHEGDKDRSKSVKTLDDAPVVVVKYPYREIDFGDSFIPYTEADFKGKNAVGNKDPRVKRIYQGFLKNQPMPYVIGFKKGGKIQLDDGYTRSGVAHMLRIPIAVKLIR